MKDLWIFNHYATRMYEDSAGRHYWFAKNLVDNGYYTTIFCANTIHNSTKTIPIVEGKYTTSSISGIPFVFVKTVATASNGLKRVLNMLVFAYNLLNVSKKYVKKHKKPSMILASSVHPFTLLAGQIIAKRLKIPCICEIRDLWPESLVTYGIFRKRRLLLSFLYYCEKLIYRKADKLIFTMEGCKDYIIEKGWDKSSGGPIDLNKIYHINNGVDLESFTYNQNHFILPDEDLDNPNIFTVVYVGSIRRANNLEILLDAAKLTDCKQIRYLVWGSGDRLDALKKRCEDEQILNILFKGFVQKEFIPSIVSRADVNLINSEFLQVMRFGGSLNKMFDYFAAGKPIIQNVEIAYGLLERYSCGEIVMNTPDATAKAVRKFFTMPKQQYLVYCENAKKAATDYDFPILTQKLTRLLV